MPAVTASWAGSHAASPGFTFPFPAAVPVQFAVANTAGDWMIAVITWRQAQAGENITVSVADDAHNWWEPIGAPSGDSSAAGVTRCAIWAAPAARAAGFVQVAASGSFQALAVRVLDVSGMQPWMSMTPVVTSYALAATSLSLSAPAPTAQALVITAAGTDNNADTISGPGAGWTALTPVTATNGSDHTADITLSGAYQVTTAATAAAWTSTGALDFSGAIAGVLVSAPAPAQPNPNWPVVITEIAPGSGAQTPPAQLQWAPLSARALSLSVQQGKQYTLSQLQAGQGTLVADNPDGALIPGQPVQWQVRFNGNGTTPNPSAESQVIGGITPGAAYQASALMFSPQNWPQYQCAVNWLTSGGAPISSSAAGTGGPFQVGVFLNPSAMGLSTWAQAAAVWQGFTGFAPSVSRVYMAGSPWTISADMTAMIAAGTKLLISVQPAFSPVSSSDFTALQTFCAALQAAGAQAEIAIWSEPFFSGLTAAQFVAAVQFYGPAIRPSYPLTFVTAASAVNNNGENGFYPGDAYCDRVATDIYAAGYLAGATLPQCAAPADTASPPKPFGIWEFNGSTGSTGQMQAQVQGFFGYVQGYMLGRVAAGQPCADVLMFSGAPGESSLGCATTAEAGFESGLGNWVNAGSASLTTTTAQAHSGTHSMALAATASGTVQAASCIAASIATQGMPCAPGDKIDGAAWFMAATVPRSCQVAIGFYTSAGVLISNIPGTAVTDSTTAFTQVTALGVTAPATSAFCRLLAVVLSAGGSGEVHWVDDAELRDVTGANAVNVTTIEFPWDYRVAGWQAVRAALNGIPAGPARVGGLVTAPAGAARYSVSLTMTGTPPATVVMEAAAGLQPAGYLTAPPLTWGPQNGSSVATLAAWAPSWPGIDSGTPLRQRVIIPAATSPHNVAFNGYLQRWPFAVPGDMLRGETQATITDVWGYGAGLLNSMAREECLLDSPHSLWPLDDPAGSQQGSNIAPGNSLPLTLTLSKLGAGGATVAFGANSGALIGDSSASLSASGSGSGGAGAESTEGMFSQTLAGTSLSNNGFGYALVCADPAYPPISGGVTIECFFEAVLGTPDSNSFTANTSGSNFNSAGTSFTSGQPVALEIASGFSLPGGFSAGVIYFVIAGTGGNFQLSATPGGSPIAVTSNGAGFVSLTTAWNPVVLSARNVRGPVAEIHIRNTDGALILLYQTAAGASGSVVVDSVHDYRTFGGLAHVSLAFNQAAYRVLVNGGSEASASGSFSGPLPTAFAEMCFGGIQDRGAQGFALPGFTALAAVYPLMLATARVVSHQAAGLTGLVGEAACDRVERLLEYAGLTGRRWLGQQVVQFEGDLVVTGQDIGGQGAATSAGNIAASTVPASLYVAPTGDIVYWSKLYSWNQPVRWTLGDNVAGGEIPFSISQFSTDYDPARVVNDVQLTQLDTQTVTVPSGVMAATTVAAVEAASSDQYGDQPLQETGYLTADATSPYNAGGSMADLANWIADVYRKPANRVQAVTVEAAANAANASSMAAWQFWAGASVGDMVAVNVRLPTAATSPLISLVARISQTNRAGQFSQDGTSATITCVLDFAPEYQVLTCDDAVRGLLNGSNVLAW